MGMGKGQFEVSLCFPDGRISVRTACVILLRASLYTLPVKLQQV